MIPFGLASAMAAFQKLLDRLLAGIPGCQHYLDDIVCTGRTQQEHDDRLSAVSSMGQLLKKDTPLEWTTEVDQEFMTLKCKISTCPALMTYNPQLLTIVTTDASDKGIGAVLSQKDDSGKERAVLFWSRQLTPSEQKYSVTEREALAAVCAALELIGGKLAQSHTPMRWNIFQDVDSPGRTLCRAFLVRNCSKCQASDKRLQERIRHRLAHYRATPHCTTGVSPAKMLHDRAMRLELPVLTPCSTDEQKLKQRVNRSVIGGSTTVITYTYGAKVTQYSRPLMIQRQVGRSSYRLADGLTRNAAHLALARGQASRDVYAEKFSVSDEKRNTLRVNVEKKIVVGRGRFRSVRSGENSGGEDAMEAVILMARMHLWE
ncbi:hypothetical protein O3P69_008364 [Scylla paramamosain]|uniref:Reverse transcriptase/retrotransposon-derived protein RNase H-like domain-containing protein n=1 Tax=Scylla paramamosain TaxID=85552 RepID=A0AAW0SMZ1_SCYPA